MLSKFIKKRFFGFNKTMDMKEACQILDIKKTDDIYSRFKHLIKINHPDIGGSPYICSKINEAYYFLTNKK